jgi:hypothetical protein
MHDTRVLFDHTSLHAITLPDDVLKAKMAPPAAAASTWALPHQMAQ